MVGQILAVCRCRTQRWQDPVWSTDRHPLTDRSRVTGAQEDVPKLAMHTDAGHGVHARPELDQQQAMEHVCTYGPPKSRSKMIFT